MKDVFSIEARTRPTEEFKTIGVRRGSVVAIEHARAVFYGQVATRHVGLVSAIRVRNLPDKPPATALDYRAVFELSREPGFAG